MKKEISKYQYVKILRPHQWLKNLLVFIPILRPNHFDYSSLQSSVIAFIAFCLIASSSYIINDLVDLDWDRRHPRKRKRPFASGSVKITHGIIISIILSVLAIITAAFLGIIFVIILLCYLLLTLTYSISLKRKIILDICVLAGLYTMRIIAGGLATSIEMSVWLLAFSMFFFLSLAAIKRQAELVSMSENKMHEGQGRGYMVEDLPIIAMIGLSSGYISVLVMALYVNSPAVQKLYSYPYSLYGICCIVLYWLTRATLITQRGAMHDDPIIFAIKDKVSYFCLAAIIGFAMSGALF